MYAEESKCYIHCDLLLTRLPFYQYVEEVTEDADGNSVSNDYLMVPDGEPSCDDVINEYEFFPVYDDASSPGVSRCDGCGDFGDISTWNIKELELHASTDWGHYTIYGTYIIIPLCAYE